MKPSWLKLSLMWILGIYPMWCGWCGCFRRWTEVKGSTGLCDDCQKELMERVLA